MKTTVALPLDNNAPAILEALAAHTRKSMEKHGHMAAWTRIQIPHQNTIITIEAQIDDMQQTTHFIIAPDAQKGVDYPLYEFTAGVRVLRRLFESQVVF